MIISVIGAGRPTAEIASLAEQVGEKLARRGAAIVCGGGRGVMEAVCKGAKSAGGTTIGILPGPDPASANRWVDFPIPTAMSNARNTIIVRSGSAVIAVGGAYGTLSEIGHALDMGVPVIGLKTWELFREGTLDRAIIVAESPEDAVDIALEAAAARPASPLHSPGGLPE